MREKHALVIKFGGSQATGMEGAKADYLHSFLSDLGSDILCSYNHIGLVIGGGPRVRALQSQVVTDHEKNMVARQVMWDHAETLKQVAASLGLQTADCVPHTVEEVEWMLKVDINPVVVVSWLKDGQSSDTSSVILAEAWRRQRNMAELVILSNVAYIFTQDPSLIGARAIRRSNVKRLVREGVLSDDPSTFTPGGHVVMDAVAVSKLVKHDNTKIPLLFGHGANSTDVRRFLRKVDPEEGTLLNDCYGETIYC